MLELSIDATMNTVKIPVHSTDKPSMVLIDPKKGKTVVVPLVDHQVF